MAAPALVISHRESSGPLDTPWGADLRRIEERIADGEHTSVRARWESGRHLLRRRKGKQLPNGLLKDVADALGVSRSELKYRVQFAERYPTEKEVANAVGHFPTWKQIVTKALPHKKPKPETLEEKRIKAFRQFVRRGEREMDEFDSTILTADDVAALADLARRINIFLEAIQ